MKNQDWLVTNEGECQPRPSQREWDLLRERYYFHQFLTEIIEILGQAPSEAEEWDYLPQIRMRVRQLVLNSYWLRSQYQEPNPQTGVAIIPLYDEIGYPLTVETVVFAPGVTTSVHNHGTWGAIALIRGQEKHTFWRRSHDAIHSDRVERVGERVFTPGELVSFMPHAIHSVEVVGDEPTVSFNLYGDVQPRSRFRFNLANHTAKVF
ncbi:MAG: cupin [Synechococcales bacterium]|nr:cupin [Synechococcales bacterium]